MPLITPGDSQPRPTGVWLQALLVASVICLVWVGIALILRQERVQFEDDAWHDADGLARGFTETIDRTIEAADQVMRTVRAVYRADPERFNIKSIAPADQVLSELTLQIAYVDAEGFVVDSNLPGGRGLDLSDREHIRIHRERKDDFLFVSKPVFGRVSNRWSIQLTRKLFKPDGLFAGVLVVSLDPDYFNNFYKKVDIGRGSITLVGFDGIVRAHAPDGRAALGQAVALPVAQALNSSANSFRLDTRTLIDNVERLYVYRQVAKQSLGVIVGIAVDDVYEIYHRDFWIYLGSGAVVTLGIAFIGITLIRQGGRLQSAQAAFAAAVENMAQGLVLIDREGIVRVINRRAIELLELPPGIARPGAPFREELVLPPDPDAKDAPATDPSAAAGSSYYERTLPNGLTLAFRSEPLPDGGMVRTFADVTQRRRHEIALAAARDAAERARRAQSDFVATMSHEIRTPLNAISGFAGLLMDAKLPARETGWAATLREAADSLTQIVNDILDFSKLDAERMTLEETEFDPAALVNGVVTLMRVKAFEKNLDLSATVDPALPARLLGDPGRLRQVLVNLVGNAVKFTATGRVGIEAAWVRAADDTPRLRLIVRDTGIGIPATSLPYVFDEFYQADSSTTRRFGGTGLGLAICRRIVTRMGGTITAESTEGVGSAFTVELPIRLAPAQATVGQPEAAADHGPRRRILLAEDNATNRLVAITRLQLLGHRVDSVADGAEAVEMVQRFPYDLVLMDIMMPGMDGIAATRAIRALEGPVRDIPIVAMTANVLPEQRDEFAAAGMNDFIGKPFAAQELADTIDRVTRGASRDPSDSEA